MPFRLILQFKHLYVDNNECLASYFNNIRLFYKQTSKIPVFQNYVYFIKLLNL